MNKIIEIKKDMVFEYVDEVYRKYFIPQKLMMIDSWYGLNLDENFNIIGFNYYIPQILNDKERFKLAEKTLDTLWAGDMLEDEDGDKFKVIQRTGNVVFVCYCFNIYNKLRENLTIDDTKFIEQIKKRGYKLVEDYPTTMSYTGGMLSGLDKVVLKFMEDVEDLKIKK